MDIPQGVDLTKQYANTYRVTDEFRPALNTTYAVGGVVKIASRDLQQWTDARTVVPTIASTSDALVVGIVSEDWPGFSQSGGFTSGASALVRGTQKLKATIGGYHPAALIDQSSSSTALVNGAPLNPSSGTAGRLAAIGTTVVGSTLAFAMLPASGLFSALGSGARAQASGTVTLTGTPATGDSIVVNIQAPYNQTNLGVAQTYTVTTVLSAAQATSVTTAAAAVVAALNASTQFATYYTATSAAGVVTIKPNGLSVPFAISHANGDYYSVSLDGAAGNGITLTTTGTTGATTATSGGALSGGTGFFGTCPVWIPFI